MQSTLLKENSLELLSSGTLEEMLSLPDEIVRHGDDVFMEFTWEDHSIIPEVVAAELEPRLLAAGCIPAAGQTRMVHADPDFLRLSVNYREQSPEFSMIALMIGAVGLIAAGTGATIFRAPIEQVLQERTNAVLIGLAVISAIILAGGIFFATTGPMGRRLQRG